MKMKIIFIFILGSSCFLTFARVNYPIFRTQKPSILIQPQSKYFSTLFNLESRFTYLTNSETPPQKPNWISLDWINSYELSPFSIQSLNVGIQTTTGSSGFIFHTVAKWIPFPDYNYQPAIGLFVDVYSGLSPQTEFLLGSNIQFLIQKNFKTHHPIVEDWGIYFAPLLRINDLNTSVHTMDWITGLIFNVKKTRQFNSEWSFNFEGRYNVSFFEIGLRFLFYIH